MQHLQPNTTLQGGKYRIERVLGQGGFGNTYVGYNTEFEETVAIKEFFMKGVTERDETTCAVSVSNADNVQQFEEQREKFKKEARRLRKLKNEHIVKVHDLFEENGTAYYVMDYIDGESLAERLKRTGKTFSEDDVREILPQVLEALEEVHGNEIWHLDLKPGNIMMDKTGKVYLIDFGASKQIRANGSMTTSTALCYTPGYAPNEQIGQMFDRFGPWTDIYALGATIYNLVTNKKPPMAIDIEEDEEDAFSFPDSVSKDFRKLVVWMMQPKRKARPQSAEEVMRRLKGKGVNVQKEQESDETKIAPKNRVFVDEPISQSETLLADKGNSSLVVEAVDLGLSVRWADRNVGSDSPSQVGSLVGWGDPTGKKMSQSLEDYLPLRYYLTNRMNTDISGTEYDIATAQCGSKWRMPNRLEWQELIERCRWDKEFLDGIQGYRVTGPNGNSIFLPFTGIRFGDVVGNKECGCYWLSERVEYDRESAYYYFFSESKQNDLVSTRGVIFSGRAVRPVCNLKEE